MIIDRQDFPKEIQCTACGKLPATNTYFAFAKDTAIIAICENCAKHLLREIADDLCISSTGTNDSGKYFEGDTVRLIACGVRFEKETQQ